MWSLFPSRRHSPASDQCPGTHIMAMAQLHLFGGCGVDTSLFDMFIWCFQIIYCFSLLIILPSIMCVVFCLPLKVSLLLWLSEDFSSFRCWLLSCNNMSMGLKSWEEEKRPGYNWPGMEALRLEPAAVPCPYLSWQTAWCSTLCWLARTVWNKENKVSQWI